MSEQHITGNVSGQNVSIGGTQNFYGAVYFGSHAIEPAPTLKNRIFLSYARGDDDPDYYDASKSFIRKLYNDLKTEHDLWWDRENMPSRGLSFLPEIRDAVADCSRLILVIGEYALKSDYVRAEWEFALSRCIPVLPILRNGDYSIIPEAVQLLHTPDFRDDSKYDKSLIELKRILGEPDAPLGTLFGVPSLPQNYIEREILDEVRGKLLADSNAPLVVTSAKEQTVTVHGVGGIGKTTLSSALARHCDVRRSFPDGIFFIEIGKTPDVLARMADVGAMFGDARQEYADPNRASQRLSAVLANKRVLLVLDDVWNQAHAKAFQVADKLCRLLITTRLGGIVTQLDAQGARLETLTEDEGLRLMAERLGTTPDTLPDACKAMIRLVDGHTLALSLIAALLAESGIGDASNLLELLKQGQVFYELKLDDDDKNLNLERCLYLSYSDLPETDVTTGLQRKLDLKRRFRQLGVLAANSTFDSAIAQALWGDDATVARQALKELVRKGLINAEVDNRYSQHGLLRTYAAALLQEASETETTFRRYAETMTKIAEKFDELPPEEWTQLDNDIPHIQHVGDTLAALYESNDNLNELALQFAYNTTNYVSRRPEIHRLNWLEMGLAVSRKAENKQRESLFLVTLGYYYNARGEKHKALDYYQQALPLKQAVGDRSGEATTLNNIGAVWDDLGEKHKSLDYFNQALPLRRQVGDKSGEASTLNNIGLVWSALDEKHKALDYFNQALPLSQAVGDRSGEATTLNNIGAVWDDLGEQHKALDYYQQALPMHREVGNRTMEATTLNNIASIYKSFGKTKEAIETFEQALNLHQTVGDRFGEIGTRWWLSILYDEVSTREKALSMIETAVKIAEAVQSPDLPNVKQLYEKLRKKYKGA
jgi:tetratricopeptide (TPR) repeat protein